MTDDAWVEALMNGDWPAMLAMLDSQAVRERAIRHDQLGLSAPITPMGLVALIDEVARLREEVVKLRGDEFDHLGRTLRKIDFTALERRER